MRNSAKIQLGALLLALMAMLGLKFGLLDFQLAFYGFALCLLIVVLFGVFGLMALVWGFIKGNDGARLVAGRMFLLGLLPLLVTIVLVGPGLSAPPIHDISTDLNNPPEFVAAAQQRTAEENSTEYEGEVIAEQQRAAFPELQPLETDLAPDAAFDHSLTVINQLGWELLDQDPASGRIEAVEETAMFGFKDDVVLRIRPGDSGGSRIDLRSNSRVGVGDLGANAARIQRFIDSF